MRIETVLRTFKVFKAVAELAYLLGYQIGKRTRK